MTVPANLVAPMMGAQAPPAAAYGGAFTTAGNGSAYGANINYGLPESSSRKVVVVASFVGTYLSDAPSCTIGGITATRIVQSVGGGHVIAIFIADVPTGTSGAVAVYLNSTATGGYFAVYSVDNLNIGVVDAKADYTSVLSTGAVPPGSIYLAGMARDGGFFSISGYNVRGGPFQQSTHHFHAWADILPPNPGGVRTCTMNAPVIIASVALF